MRYGKMETADYLTYTALTRLPWGWRLYLGCSGQRTGIPLGQIYTHTHICARARAHAHTQAYAHARTHAHTHTHTHAHARTNTHTHTHTTNKSQLCMTTTTMTMTIKMNTRSIVIPKSTVTTKKQKQRWGEREGDTTTTTTTKVNVIPPADVQQSELLAIPAESRLGKKVVVQSQVDVLGDDWRLGICGAREGHTIALLHLRC